ncbi:MAG: hypothetical protein LBM09_01905 [Candidatus Nomurabacteria bacterium]|nr:hypothetical protein [Candidatus Nomurabacteria bacterium]
MIDDQVTGIDDSEVNQMIAGIKGGTIAPPPAPVDPYSAPIPAFVPPQEDAQPSQFADVTLPAPAPTPIASLSAPVIETPAEPAVEHAPTPLTQPIPTPSVEPAKPITPAVEPTKPAEPVVEPVKVTTKVVKPAPALNSAPANDSDFASMKQDALRELRPLVDKLDLPADEKFDTLLLLIRSTDDSSLIAEAHNAARQIQDEARRARALLDIIKEIDYFGHKAA